MLLEDLGNAEVFLMRGAALLEFGALPQLISKAVWKAVAPSHADKRGSNRLKIHGWFIGFVSTLSMAKDRL